MGKNFVILGMGFVSRRHLESIKSIGGNLIAYHDISDVVGQVDAHFIDAKFYREFIHFDCFIDRYLEGGGHIDYAVILLPNHLHNPACHWALTRGIDVIVEKPTVINERNLDELERLEYRTGRTVNTVLQLRYHPNIPIIREKHSIGRHKVRISYCSKRGPWFLGQSWKGDINRSGGLSLAIGVHAHDLAVHLFGKCNRVTVSSKRPDEESGTLRLENADVEWLLSVAPERETERIFEIDGTQYDFSTNFTNLHTKVYEEIIAGRGIGLEECREAIKICQEVRESSPISMVTRRLGLEHESLNLSKSAAAG